jgi:hypothetical protein
VILAALVSDVDMANQAMRTYVSYYATGLGALSIAGAGLVYSTIFGHVVVSSLVFSG